MSSFLLPTIILFLTVFPIIYLLSTFFTIEQLSSIGCLILLLAIATSIAINTIKQQGVLEYCPNGLKTLLTETVILEWLTDTTFFEQNIKPLVPLLLNPSAEEIIEVLRPMKPSWQHIILQPGGFGRLFDKDTRRWLHPKLLEDVEPINLPERTAKIDTETTTEDIDSSSIISGQLNSYFSDATKKFQDLLITMNTNRLRRTSMVALSALVILLVRSKIARQTSAIFGRAVLVFGLGFTGISAAFAAYKIDEISANAARASKIETQKCLTSDRNGEKQEGYVLDTSTRGIDGARVVLKQVSDGC